MYLTPPANLEATRVVYSPANGDLLAFFGSIGGFLGLLATIREFLLGTRTSLVSPGCIDATLFKRYLERLFARLVPPGIAAMIKRKQIKKSDDEESYFIIRASGGSSADAVELQDTPARNGQ
jgi:hypothetical protein